MSATETIIGFAAKFVFDQVFGGPARVVSSYHKQHIVFLFRAIRESDRDWRIQGQIGDVRKKLKEMTKAGAEIESKVPANPEPPSSDLGFLTDPARAREFQARVDAYTAGLQAIIGLLEQYQTAASDLLDTVEREIKAIEQQLTTKGSSWAAFRQISNASRQQELDLLKIGEVEDLGVQIGRIGSLLRRYKDGN